MPTDKRSSNWSRWAPIFEWVDHTQLDALMADRQTPLDKRPTCEKALLGTPTKRLQTLIAKSPEVGGTARKRQVIIAHEACVRA